MNLETATDDVLKQMKQNKVLLTDTIDEGFDFGEEDGSGSDSDSGSEVDVDAI